MQSILRGMQSTVIKYANILSQILRVDVEIVDRDLYRVAGTGLYMDKVNRNMGKEGYVYNEVMKTGEQQIVMDPGNHPICKHCYKKGNCDETFEISMPLKIDNEVIGVMGLVCFTEDQKDHILSNLQVFTEFLEQISDLISSKAREELEKETMINNLLTLGKIIEKVDQGIIVIDKDNNLVNINNMAIKIFNLKNKPESIEYIKPTGQEILNHIEYELMIGDKKHIILGEDYEVIRGTSNYNKIYTFTDISTLEYIYTSVSVTKENMNLKDIIGNSKDILQLKEKIKMIDTSSSTVLIRGESGTGKELFARAVHMESYRKNEAFVALNCAAIPDALLESELFGYVKGAFTGADPKGKIGKIEFANNGTLFLDEIGDMPIYLQTKLLRILEEREVVRLGSNQAIPVDIRIIAATNKNLEEMIEDNMFREDLYYRLNVIPMEISPLRERKEDIKVLLYYFIKKYSKLFDKKNINISKDVWKLFENYNWPGNVRELENIIEYAMNMVKSNSSIELVHIPKSILEKEENINCLSLEKIEKKYIKKALKIYGQDKEGKERAANELGIGIATLYRKIKKYKI